MIWASLFLLSFSTLGEPAKAPPVPFWKAKEKVYQRIVEERAIIVAVHTDTIKDGERLVLGGGGRISVPIAFAFEQAMKFENLKEASDYVKEAREENGLLYLKAGAFGHDAEMWFKLTPMPTSGIHFEVVKGTLKGLIGDLHFEKIESVKTEIGISGQYDYVKFPIAKIFAEFGIEAILQRMAVRLRSRIEELYRGKVQ